MTVQNIILSTEHQGLCSTFIFLSQRTPRSVQNKYLCATENTKILCRTFVVCHRKHRSLCRTHSFLSQRSPRSVQNTYLSVIENTKVCAERISLCHREHQGLCRTFIFCHKKHRSLYRTFVFVQYRAPASVQNIHLPLTQDTTHYIFLAATDNTSICAEQDTDVCAKLFPLWRVVLPSTVRVFSHHRHALLVTCNHLGNVSAIPCGYRHVGQHP